MPRSASFSATGDVTYHDNMEQLYIVRLLETTKQSMANLLNKVNHSGVEVVQEMNRFGMMVGVSHLSRAGVLHVAEITKQPIVSTHQNIVPFVKSSQALELTPEEVQAVAATGGVIGLRYIEGQVPYRVLADECEHLAKAVGVQHIGIGWLGHDAGHPYYGWEPGAPPDPRRRLSDVETQTLAQHWETFIGLLAERGFTDDQIAMIVGGNFLRVMRAVLPEA